MGSKQMDVSRTDNQELAIRERLAEIGLDDDNEAMTEVVEQFRLAIRSHTDAVTEAIASADLVAVAHAAHKLSGTAVTLGADDLGRLASHVEADAANRRTATLEVQTGPLAAEAERAIAAAGSILASIS